MAWFKFGVGILWTVFSCLIAAIPPAVFYLIWHLVNPTDEFVKAFLAIGLVVAGSGVTLLFGFLAFALWVSGMSALGDMR